VGGNPEIVRPGVEGLLVPRGDDGATAAALAHLLDDSGAAAAMGAAGRARVEQRYRLADTIENYARLYERLRKGKGIASYQSALESKSRTKPGGN
jgi:glycosyltransferase involved in cell wall biosynthesis